jgi:hypothetical protein
MALSDYEILDHVSETARYVLRRGRRRQDNVPVLLKTARIDVANSNNFVALEHEYELLQGLTVTGVPRA